MSLDGLPDSTFKGQGWKYHFNTFTLRGKFNVSTGIHVHVYNACHKKYVFIFKPPNAR